jgi:hypothetical protein
MFFDFMGDIHMLMKILETVSFGRRYVMASLFYMGVGLVLLAIVPSESQVLADGDCGCPPDTRCVLVGEEYECECVE